MSDKKTSKKSKKAKAVPPLTYVDAGVNLHHPKFSKDLNQVISFAQERGVQYLVMINKELKTIHRTINMCKDNRSLICTVGIHPNQAKFWDEKRDLPNMKSLLQKNWQVIKAVGECGLDYSRMISSQEKQLSCFEAQVKLACAEKVPLYIHERDAHHDLVEVLTKYQDQLPRVLIHSFTGNDKQLDQYIKMGFYIGLSGLITTQGGEHLKKLIPLIPLDKMVVESNSPFMVPYGVSDLLVHNRRNEPCTIPYIVRSIREAYNSVQIPSKTITALDLSEILWKNSISFFAIS